MKERGIDSGMLRESGMLTMLQNCSYSLNKGDGMRVHCDRAYTHKHNSGKQSDLQRHELNRLGHG